MGKLKTSLSSKKRRIQLTKLAVIVGLWAMCGFLIHLYDYLSLYAEISAGPSAKYSFVSMLVFNVLAGVIGGLLGGSFLVFYVNEKMRNHPYGITLLLVALGFFCIVLIITLVLGVWLIKSQTGSFPYTDYRATEQFHAYLINPLHFKNILIWGSITTMTQLLLQVNDKFGQGLLWGFIKGKYHKARKEQRIFLFLDLTGSTAIAEKLGNVAYYKLLRDFYADITDSIIYNGGNIYQYVGDEAVISWEYQEKKVDDRCLTCYFDIREKLSSLQTQYESRYGLCPDFKAAIHFGHVVVGEIGIIKKDITYCGDVLNTTARILARCHEYGHKLLISGQLEAYLNYHRSKFRFKKVGEEILRGKSEVVEIYTVFQ